MRRPALHAVALALLVVTAGCSGFASQPTDGTTTADDATGTPTTVERTTDEADADAELLPGLTERGVEDPSALADAHRERLADRSLTNDIARIERYANGTLRNEQNQTTRAAANRTRYRVVANVSNPNVLAGGEDGGELWANGTHVFRAHTSNGTTNYSLLYDPQSVPMDPRDQLGGDLSLDERILVLFNAFEGERVEQMDEGNATFPERYRVTATDLAHPDVVGPTGAEVRNATLEAVIETDDSESALVREYALRYETTIDGETVRVTMRNRFSHVGETTVERPEWYDGAANRTD